MKLINFTSIQITCFLFGIVLLFNGCDKQIIEKKYSGEFEITKTVTSQGNTNGVPESYYDTTYTIIAPETLKVTDGNFIIISMKKFEINKSGSLKLVSEYYDPHYSTSFCGSFSDGDNFQFTYSNSGSFTGHSSNYIEFVTGKRK